VARVAVLVPDLLFGSNVEGALRAAGHEVLRGDAQGVDVVVADLTADDVDIEALGARTDVATLGFYPHVQVEVRARAEAAGFDMVVPRSRMSREGAALVGRLAEGA
jgi:uncharacterized membrane-anchored protein